MIADHWADLQTAYYTAYLALHYFALQRQHATNQQSAPGSSYSKSLIFISSLVAYMDYAETMYTSSKFGVRGLFRSIRTKAQEQHNVRCNNIAPWHLRTAQTAALHEHFQARGLQEGKGYTFASLETLVEAVCQCAVTEDFSGKQAPLVHHIPSQWFWSRFSCTNNLMFHISRPFHCHHARRLRGSEGGFRRRVRWPRSHESTAEALRCW